MDRNKVTTISLILAVGVLAFLVYRYLPGYQFNPDQWKQDLAKAGSSSSPIAVDLNKDGILDIVMGGAAQEFVATASGVFALDGRDGSILWKHKARNQIFGTAITKDINGDSIPEIFIGGRSACLFALNGKDGSTIWEYLEDDTETDYVNDSSIQNFFNLQWVPDLDEDGVEDILTAYGGFVKAKRGDSERPPGSLMILSGKTGKMLARAFAPDGQEMYMSPLIHSFNKDQDLTIIFGTGGEDLDGRLYKASLKMLMNGDLANASVLLEGNGKGFIAPPLLIDVNLDGVKEIVVNSVDGRMACIDGKSSKTLWESRLKGSFDTYTMPAPGYFFGDDSIPDFFSSFGKGPWPDTDFTVHTLTDGRTGKMVYTDTLGSFQYASPIVEDFDGDGSQDVLIVINTLSDSKVEGLRGVKFLNNKLIVYPGGQGEPFPLLATRLGTNLGSTPLFTDLDQDGYMDLVFAYMSDASLFYSFKNLRVERVELKRRSQNSQWTSYMGNEARSTVD